VLQLNIQLKGLKIYPSTGNQAKWRFILVLDPAILPIPGREGINKEKIDDGYTLCGDW
jgi:hypothetical protein